MNRKSSAGFTLVEIMVGLGLLSVLGLAFAQIMANASKGQNNVKLDMDTRNAAITAGLAMQDNTTCNHNIPGNIVGPATFDNTLTVKQLQAVHIPLSQITTSSGAVLYSTGSLLDPTLTIQNIFLTGITVISPTSAIAHIEIDGLKKTNTYLGSPIAAGTSAPFNVTTTTSGATSTISSCNAVASATVFQSGIANQGQVTFPTPYPSSTSVNVLCTAADGESCTVDNITPTGFTLNTAGTAAVWVSFGQ